MTALKKRAINMIEQMPEEQVVFVISIIENVQSRPRKKKDDETDNLARKAFKNLQRLSRPGTVNDDYRKELEEALWEKSSLSGVDFPNAV